MVKVCSFPQWGGCKVISTLEPKVDITIVMGQLTRKS